MNGQLHKFASHTQPALTFLQKYKTHFLETLTLAYPIVISQFSHIMVGVADSVMVGRTGDVNSLAAVSLGSGIFTVVLVFALGFSMAATPLVSQAFGGGNHEECTKVLSGSFYVNLLLAVFSISIYFTLRRYIGLLDQPEPVVALTLPFLMYLALSMVPLMLFQTIKQFMEGLGHTRPAMLASVGANLLNLVLNYILIFGKLGFPAMGIVGAGMATLISRVVMALALFVIFITAPEFKKYPLALATCSTRVVRKLLNMGLPIALQFTFETGAFAAAAVMVGWIGANELAAHQTALSLASLTYMMASGIAAATSVRVGQKYGAGDHKGLRIAGSAGFLMSAIFMGITAVLFLTFRSWLPSLYISDPLVIGIAANLFVIVALFQLSDGIQVAALGALRGVSDVKIPSIFAFIAYWIVGLPSGYMLFKWLDWGIYGVWIGLWLGLTASAILMVLRFYLITKPTSNRLKALTIEPILHP
jgi:MATE family multidrug resistance protein